MNITEGSLVILGRKLYYVENLGSPSYIYNADTGGKFIDNFKNATLLT
jgi:hypothetical protein